MARGAELRFGPAAVVEDRATRRFNAKAGLTNGRCRRVEPLRWPWLRIPSVGRAKEERRRRLELPAPPEALAHRVLVGGRELQDERVLQAQRLQVLRERCELGELQR